MPGQTSESIAKTLDKVIEIQPTQVQPMLLHYKPWVRKYQIKMLKDGPLPDFMERKDLLDVIDQRLKKAGYLRVAFESLSLIHI